MQIVLAPDRTFCGRSAPTTSRLPRVRDAGANAVLPLPTLVDRALAGDQVAWKALVDRLKGVVWKVLYGFDMSEDDRKDAFASTFFRLYERLGTVREPEKLPGWLATTARNEAHGVVRRKNRLVPVAEMPVLESADPANDEQVLEDELRDALRQAFANLPGDAQQALRLLCADPPIGYDEISRLLGMPRGSIGALRRRCLDELRNSPQLSPFIKGGSR